LASGAIRTGRGNQTQDATAEVTTIVAAVSRNTTRRSSLIRTPDARSSANGRRRSIMPAVRLIALASNTNKPAMLPRRLKSTKCCSKL
jgi:hypothetical protein